MYKLLSSFCIFMIALVTAQAQSLVAAGYWQELAPAQIALPESAVREFEPDAYHAYQLDYNAMCQHLAKAPRENTAEAKQPLAVLLPTADGSFEKFAMVETPVMGEGLQSKYPSIRTYTGYSMEETSKKIKVTLSPEWGFHGLIRNTDKGVEYIEQLARGQNTYYMVYDRKAFPAQYRHPERINQMIATPDATHYSDSRNYRPQATPVVPEDRGVVLDVEPVKLKIYRFACATTGEFAIDQGGTLSSVLAKMVSYTNDLNSIYEFDLDIRLVLIDSIEKILFLNPATDPYTGTLVVGWMAQNPGAMNNVIGQNSYDIGHVFARYQGGDAAGVAGGLCCGDFKGRGCSSANLPYGDYFFSVVGQEIGHQWSAGHTWTYCDSPPLAQGDAPSSACEPGSGSTIMSYGGVCGSTNVQNGADLYYNVCSIFEIRGFVENGLGNTCGSEVVSDNFPPVSVISNPNGLFIPISTPFELTGVATDPDGDAVTYCWEQIDTGPLVKPGEPQGSTPLFRTFPPVTGGSRTFPRIQTVVANTNNKYEVLPTYNRDLNFCLTARDNQLGGGGVGFDTIELRSTILAGPFVVTYPNTNAEVWHPGEYQYVRWNVANTNVSPVNCKLVNILLSTNGGTLYPIVLAAGVPNTGSACVLVPNNLTATARIRVQAADNVFFDISNANFKIEAPTAPGFGICNSQYFQQACLPEPVSVTIGSSTWAGFAESITYSAAGLPSGAVATFSPNPAPAGTDVAMSLDMGNNPEGSYDLFIIGATTNLADTTFMQVKIVSNDFSALSLLVPVDGAAGISQSPKLRWQKVGDADRYEVQVATNPSFAPGTFVYSNPSITIDSIPFTSNLERGTDYYWRVRAVNVCGTSDWTPVNSFSTLVEVCNDYIAQDLPKNISGTGTPTIESQISLAAGGLISDINVTKLAGSHDAFNQLDVRLISPLGTEIILFRNKCGESSLSMNIGFDDGAASPAFPCPPNTGNYARPQQLLTAFNGQNSQGTWILRIKDTSPPSGGQITDFALEICSATALNPPLLINNNPLSLPSGTNAQIQTSLLKADDADNVAGELIFTVVSAPAFGYLHVDGVGTIGVGAQFSQADIDAGGLRYYNYGASTGADAFRFTVIDGNGGFANGTFQIQATVGTKTISNELAFSLSPNPTSGSVRLDFGTALPSAAQVTATDASGKLVRSFVLPSGTQAHTMSVESLPSGIYTIRIQHERGIGVQRLVVE